MNEYIATTLKNWVPFRLFEKDDINYCRWLYLGDKQFTDPFFSDTASRCMNLPENSRRMHSISSMEILPDWAKYFKPQSPAVFIFHISRCGSTLLSQMLGIRPTNTILSEVPFFDDLLRWGQKENKMGSTINFLKAAIDLYGQKGNEGNSQLIIKTDSWQVHYYKMLRQLYPDALFILLYRKPDEVIRSHQLRRGMQSVPGLLEPEIFGFNKDKIVNIGLDEYMAMVIESYLDAFIEISGKDKSAIAVNYNEGMLSIVKKIAILTEMTFTDKEWELMKTRTLYHGKYPEQVFSELPVEKQVPPYLNKCFGLYDQLENIRMHEDKH